VDAAKQEVGRLRRTVDTAGREAQSALAEVSHAAELLV